MNTASKVLLLVLLCAAPAFAQNVRVDNVTFSSVQGFPFLPGATITICTAAGSGLPCSPTVAGTCLSISDTTCNQSATLTSDALGNYGFWIQPGSYSYTVTKAGFGGFGPKALTLSCQPSSTCTTTGPQTINNICVTNGFYFAATPTCYANVSAAFDAACALSPVGTVTIPPGTYTGPLASHFCSNLRIMGLSPGESRPMVSNLGVTPLTATTAVTLTYVATLNLSGIQNMRIENVMLDFGACTGCSFALTSSSFNQFIYVTLNNVGDTGTGQAALLVTVTNGSGANLGSVWNTFDHLRINCNNAASHYCYAAVELLGAGVVNGSPAAFATLNKFWDLGVTGQYKYCIDAELNSDTNYFWYVNCNADTAPPANSATLAFNLNNPTSDQDADGGVYDGVIVAGFGPASFIRSGQSNGNIIRISRGGAGQPSLTDISAGCTLAVGCPPTYSVQSIGLPGVTPDLYIGGRINAVAAMGTNSPGVAGDIMAERTATTGFYYLGTDGGNINRLGTQLNIDGTHIAGFGLTEQAANPCSTGVDLLFGYSVPHQLQSCYNSTTFFPVPQTGNTAGTHSDSGFYQTAGAAGCTTAASIGGVCATPVTITWPVTFADANYKVSCTPIGPATNLPSSPYVVTPIAASVTINYFAITAAAASWPTVNCTAVHN